MLLENDGINFSLKVIFNLSYKHSPILSLSLRSFYTDRKIICISLDLSISRCLTFTVNVIIMLSIDGT